MTNEKPHVKPDKSYSVAQAGTLLGLHRVSVWRYIKKGLLSVTVSTANGRTRIKGREILRFWESEF